MPPRGEKVREPRAAAQQRHAPDRESARMSLARLDAHGVEGAAGDAGP